MRCPELAELPAPPPARSGWPWTEATPGLAERTADGGEWPRISIVTPSYNQAYFIEETIRAILLQGYPNLEYIVSEDCSTDNTLEVVRKYERWLTVLAAEKNGGMSKAINRAWPETTGEIVTWISSDDVYLPGAFHRVAAAYRQNPAAGEIVGAFRFIGPDSRFTSEAIPPRLPQGSPVRFNPGGTGSMAAPPGVHFLCAARFRGRRLLCPGGPPAQYGPGDTLPRVPLLSDNPGRRALGLLSNPSQQQELVRWQHDRHGGRVFEDSGHVFLIRPAAESAPRAHRRAPESQRLSQIRQIHRPAP